MQTTQLSSHAPSAPRVAYGSDTSEQRLSELMERYVAGDEAAFNELYRAASPRLFGYLHRLTRDGARAEDLLQTTFLKLYRSRDRYQPGSPVLPWLFAIGRNSFKDETRGQRAKQEVVTRDGSLPEVGTTLESRREDAREELLAAFADVPRTQRDAVMLTKLFGFSVAEAASLLGTTASSIKLRVHRGLHGLRAYAWA